MKWKQEQEKPHKLPSATLRHGDIAIVISQTGEETWQHFTLSLCVRSESTRDQCKETWPRESIAVARRKLDAFEETLNEEDGQ
jgi:hypothetical protein